MKDRSLVSIAALTAMLSAPFAFAQPADLDLESWQVRIARMEGASTNTRESAEALVESAQRIAAAGRLQDLSELVSDANELNRRVISARLAAEVLDQQVVTPR